MSEWQRLLAWCSEADVYARVPHLTRDGTFARIYSGEGSLEALINEVPNGE